MGTLILGNVGSSLVKDKYYCTMQQSAWPDKKL